MTIFENFHSKLRPEEKEGLDKQWSGEGGVRMACDQ